MLAPQGLHCVATEKRTWEFLDYEPFLPVTEKSNPLTSDIDRADPEKIVQMLRECDAEIFERPHSGSVYQRLRSQSVVHITLEVAKRVEKILKEPDDSLIVMSGCGTSGRMAFLMAAGTFTNVTLMFFLYLYELLPDTSFNRRLKALQQPQIYSYIIAGGDKALLTSQEAPEDNPALGARMLDKACEGKKHVLFIGISCGLSAPFVAGQLQFCLHHLDIFTPVLIGFNPVNMARDEPMRECPLNFKEVSEKMLEMQRRQKAFILNPTVGPEAISGSSRMKGGSATKILLENVLSAGHSAAFGNKEITPDAMLARIGMYERVHDVSYSQSECLAALIQRAGLSLRRGGHVYNLGWKTLGVIGIIDASECIPTFGADFEDIRGFISKGFAEMNNKEGDLSSMGPQFRVDHSDFVNITLPTLNENDMVIFLFTEADDLNEVTELANKVRQRTSNLCAVVHDAVGNNVPENISKIFEVVLKTTWLCPSDEGKEQQWELSTKFYLNAISTGAHILKGKIYRNYMIDLRVTNSKLYRRAVHMLQRFTSRSQMQCETALLRALYDVEEIPNEMSSADVQRHTEVANTRDRIVPTALVLLLCGCTLTEAKARLDGHAVIRDAINACMNAMET